MRNILITLGLIIFSGCAYSGLVTMNSSGHLTIEELSREKESSIHYAKWRANNYCKKHKKIAMIMNEKTDYQGILDEEVVDVARRAEDVVWKSGGGLNPAAQVLGAVSSDTDYKTTVEFECR